MQKLLAFTLLPEPDYVYGCLLVLAFTCLQLLGSASIGLSFHLSTRLAGRTRAAVVAMIYQKILRLRSLKGKSVGEVSVIVEEKKGKLLYKRDKKGDYASFCA